MGQRFSSLFRAPILAVIAWTLAMGSQAGAANHPRQPRVHSAKQPRFEVYVASHCAQCRATLRFLDIRRIDYSLRVLDQDRIAEQQYLNAYGHGLLPLVRYRTQIVRGFQPDRLLTMLSHKEGVSSVSGGRAVTARLPSTRPPTRGRRQERTTSAPRPPVGSTIVKGARCSAATLKELADSYFTSQRSKKWRFDLAAAALAAWKDGRANDRRSLVEGFGLVHFGDKLSEVIAKLPDACQIRAERILSDAGPESGDLGIIECSPGLEVLGHRTKTTLGFDSGDPDKRITRISIEQNYLTNEKSLLGELCEKYGEPNDSAAFLSSNSGFDTGCGEDTADGGRCRPHFFFAGYQIEVSGTLNAIIYHSKDAAITIAQEMNLKRAEEAHAREQASRPPR